MAILLANAAKLVFHDFVEPANYVLATFFVISAIALPVQMLHGHYRGYL